MGFPKKVRLHIPGGRGQQPSVRTEPFGRFCAANGCKTRQEGAALLDEWIRKGIVARRADGGYDVLRFEPRRGQPVEQPDEVTAALAALSGDG